MNDLGNVAAKKYNDGRMENMFCRKCGSPIQEGVKFCRNCGCPVSAWETETSDSTQTKGENVSEFSAPGHQAEPSIQQSQTIQAPYPVPPIQKKSAQKKKGKSTILLAVLSVILAVVLVLQNLGLIGLVTGKGTLRIEGKGYASAEEAVTAYINALRQGDVPAMVSTFAVESYVDHVDTNAWVDTYGCLSLVTGDRVYELTGSDYERQLRYCARQNAITERLHTQLLYCTAYMENELEIFEATNFITFYNEDNPEEALEEFLDIFRADSFGKTLSKIELKKFIDPEDLDDFYNFEGNQDMMERFRKAYGCDEYKSVAVLVMLDGDEWLLTMDCGSYDGRWYNVEPYSQIARMLYGNTFSGGLLPYSEVR